MPPIQNKELILELVEKYLKVFPQLDNSAMTRATKEPAMLQAAAALVDEVESLSVDFHDFSTVLNEVNNKQGSEQIKKLRMLACLHTDELQAKRLNSTRQSATAFSVMIGVKVRIENIDLSRIKENEPALKDISHLFGITDQEWINHIVSTDDATLAYTRCIEISYLYKSDLMANLGENPNIRTLLTGTPKYQLKDLSRICLMPFSSEFNRDTFNKEFPDAIDPQLAQQHGSMLLAGCFRKAMHPMRMGASLDAKPGQAECIKHVLTLFADAGVDWFKPWLSSREEMYPMALGDLEGMTYSDEEKALHFVKDSRNFGVENQTIKYVLRNALINQIPVQALINIYENQENRDEMMEFFFKETSNPVFIHAIVDQKYKVSALSDDMGM
jgi:hypothetical protein